jgi:hypothetical protein
MCPRWQDRLLKIKRAKRLSEMLENNEEIPDMNDDGQVDAFDIAHLDKEKRNPKQVRYDLNPNLLQLIIVDCVLEIDGRVQQCDNSAKLKLEAILTEHLVFSLPVIGVSSLHHAGGYAGLEKVASYLNMNVPVLMLDVRERAPNLKALKKELKDNKEELVVQCLLPLNHPARLQQHPRGRQQNHVEQAAHRRCHIQQTPHSDALGEYAGER